MVFAFGKVSVESKSIYQNELIRLEIGIWRVKSEWLLKY